MNDLYHHSLGTYQAHHHYYGEGQGHHSLGMYHVYADPIFYNPTVTNSMMSSTIVGMFTSGSQNSLNEYLDLLYRNIFFGAQAFATTIGLLHSSRLFRFTFLVALFVKVTIHSLIMSPSGMRSRGI
jgi:hypothetical protein